MSTPTTRRQSYAWVPVQPDGRIRWDKVRERRYRAHRCAAWIQFPYLDNDVEATMMWLACYENGWRVRKVVVADTCSASGEEKGTR